MVDAVAVVAAARAGDCYCRGRQHRRRGVVARRCAAANRRRGCFLPLPIFPRAVAQLRRSRWRWLAQATLLLRFRLRRLARTAVVETVAAAVTSACPCRCWRLPPWLPPLPPPRLNYMCTAAVLHLAIAAVRERGFCSPAPVQVQAHAAAAATARRRSCYGAPPPLISFSPPRLLLRVAAAADACLRGCSPPPPFSWPRASHCLARSSVTGARAAAASARSRCFCCSLPTFLAVVAAAGYLQRSLLWMVTRLYFCLSSGSCRALPPSPQLAPRSLPGAVAVPPLVATNAVDAVGEAVTLVALPAGRSIFPTTIDADHYLCCSPPSVSVLGNTLRVPPFLAPLVV